MAGCGGGAPSATPGSDAGEDAPSVGMDASAGDDAVTVADSGHAGDVAAVGVDAPGDRGGGEGSPGNDGSAPPGLTPKQKVLAYLASISGKKTVAGQHDKNNATPTDATDQVQSITGKVPGLWSGDFLFGGDVADRPTMIAEAQKQWTAGAIVHLMYHACAPTGDESCSWDDIGGANPVHLTDQQWSDLITSGTALNQAWIARLDALSVFFQELKDAGVAPLFRPQHEMNQGVFWWGGRPGPSGTRRLYQITHDYLVQLKGFDNIIWVWDLQDFSTLGTDVSDYDPGDTYYDIAALDVYDGPYDASKYQTMTGVPGNKLIAIGECSTLPTPDELLAQPAWTFVMLWPDFISNNQSALPVLYTATNVVTLDQMPGW
jgi:hypothetical protein